MPTLPAITVRDLEVLMDALAYMLQTDGRTSNISWILGEPGMARPGQTPFGFIHPQTESVSWYTANGSNGGLAAGLDDWNIPIILLVCHEPHRTPIEPIRAVPPSSSPFTPANLTASGLVSPAPYWEQPGWRKALNNTQNIKKVLRSSSDPVVGGAASTTHIVESRYILIDINDNLFRATRMTVQAQQRRVRGN